MRSAIAARMRSIEADISTLALDAIVNAANEPLIMGGGVDGAIRRKAGPEMEVELRRIGRCPTGTAVITRGYRLAVKYVIHTVAPIWSAAGSSEEDLLAACYRNALSLADMHALGSIAFPCIGTGIYGWPPDLAADLAFSQVVSHLRSSPTPAEVVFCCFQPKDYERYANKIAGANA